MAEMYKLRTAKRNGGHVEYFEDLEKLKASLVIAYLESLRSDRRRDVSWLRFILAGRWATHLRNGDEDFVPYERIVAVEQFVDGEWKELRPEFVEPEVHLYAGT